MKADAPLVWTDGTVHLNAEAAVDANLPTVVNPGNAEHDHTLRLRYALHNFEIHQPGVLYDVWCYAFHHFSNRLMKLCFSRISGDNTRHEAINVILNKLFHIAVILTNTRFEFPVPRACALLLRVRA